MVERIKDVKCWTFWKNYYYSKIEDIENYVYKCNHIRAHTGLEKAPRGNFKRPKDLYYDFSIH